MRLVLGGRVLGGGALAAHRTRHRKTQLIVAVRRTRLDRSRPFFAGVRAMLGRVHQARLGRLGRIVQIDVIVRALGNGLLCCRRIRRGLLLAAFVVGSAFAALAAFTAFAAITAAATAAASPAASAATPRLVGFALGAFARRLFARLVYFRAFLVCFGFRAGHRFRDERIGIGLRQVGHFADDGNFLGRRDAVERQGLARHGCFV